MVVVLFILFLIYVVLRIRLFIKEKEWRDLTIFAVLSAMAAYAIVMPSLGWRTGALLHGEYRVAEPIARQFLQVIFGANV